MWRRFWREGGGVLVGLFLLATLPLLQRIPNGSDHYYMIDVGETQVVLNNWGTLHATGYPLYTVLGNLLTDALTALGTPAGVAPAWVSWGWGIIATVMLWRLWARLSGRAWLAMLAVVALVFTRTVWIHMVIAEIYSFGWLLLIALLGLALLPHDSPSRRIDALALLGGIAVGHHRALLMVAPALLFATQADLIAQKRRIAWVLLKALGLGVLGLLPYLYLVGRARMGADWVYGEPSTWQGLWDQFIGTEANRFIGLPTTWEHFVSNLTLVHSVILTDVHPIGLALGLIGWGVGILRVPFRRASWTFGISGGVAYAFHVLVYQDVLSALILPILLLIGWGWLMLLVATWEHPPRWKRALIVSVWVAGVSALVGRHALFIHEQVNHPRGLETIDSLRSLPSGASVMIPWGVRYFAAGFARDITGELAHINLLDHKADYRHAFEQGTLYTPEYMRHLYPLSWWQAQLGAVAVEVALPSVVRISPPVLTSSDTFTSQAQVTCAPQHLDVWITWQVGQSIPPDRSVFVHLLGADGAVLAQDDRFAPVYGWRPFSTFTPFEQVRDLYQLPRLPLAQSVRFGLYYQDNQGQFVNEHVHTLDAVCY
jgi:hypothetical protein